MTIEQGQVAPVPDLPAERYAPRPRRRATVGRELRSWQTHVLAAFCLFVGVPLTILLTPAQSIEAAGQHLSVGARAPEFNLSGPAQLVQIGNTELDIAPLRVYGPLRPQLILGPVQRNAEAAAVLDPATSREAQAAAVDSLRSGYLRWFGWATVGLILFTLAATVAAGYVRTLAALRRQSRDVSVPYVWHESAGQMRGMTVVAVTAVLIGWSACGVLAFRGAVSGIQNVRSLSQMVGTYHLPPAPVGPKVSGYAGAVIGDSRAARVGGPLAPDATAEDRACQRSTDSLAAQIGNLTDSRVLNLACSGASIATGLRGPQEQGGLALPSQVGLLKQVQGLEFVVVVIGPNDLSWSDQLLYCYQADDCSDNLTAGEFEYRLAAFDRAYGELLRDLNDLTDDPQIIIVTSYDLFRPDAAAECPDVRGPDNAPGLSAADIELLNGRNTQLNDVLSIGAEKYEFQVAQPRLTALCQPAPDQLGPDLQGLGDGQPFHPTAVGVLRMASAVTAEIKSDPVD